MAKRGTVLPQNDEKTRIAEQIMCFVPPARKKWPNAEKFPAKCKWENKNVQKRENKNVQF
ncbi:hypothetical protein [Eubacterium sp. AB3007]|uniref:hypothetical protein n=1 Tax=Eubacterium sp. AB3007 TaxID=1392487 RepID=UPI0016395D4D|nr:hypothetical protein [Eubacterium sp. AB3007]